MSAKASTGTEETTVSLNPPEPRVNWFEFILKLAGCCAAKHGLKKKSRWRKYEARHFWEVIVFGILNSLGMEDAAKRWNDLKWEKLNENARRKRHPRKLGGKRDRYERLAPDRSQVNDFKRQFPQSLVDDLSTIVFREQILLALDLGLITSTIDVFVDFTDEPYYGVLKVDESNSLHGTNRAPGTNRVRKYLGIMIKSGQMRLFSHVILTSSGVHKNDYMNEAIDDLLSWGFTIRRIAGDREFVSRQLIDKCIQDGIHYFGPFVKTQNVKKKMEKYLHEGGTGIYRYKLKGKGYWHKKIPAETWLILHTEEDIGLKGIRKDFKDGKVSLKEAMSQIYVFISTRPLPRAKRRRNGQKLAWIRWYTQRWWIETAFRDFNEFFPSPHARFDGAKSLMMLLRAWLYNAWLMFRGRNSWDTRKKEFCYTMEQEFLMPLAFVAV